MHYLMGRPTIPSLLLVCTRCRPPEADPLVPRAGATLRAATKAQVTGDHTLRVQGAPRLSACKQACADVLMAPGRVSDLFTNVPADANGAADLVAFAHRYAAADGDLPRAVRPERPRAGILARLPPLRGLAEAREELAWPA